MKIALACPPGLFGCVPEPTLAKGHLPDWLRQMPATADSAVIGAAVRTVKQCPPFVDAMQAGILFRLAADVTVSDGVLHWSTNIPAVEGGRHSRAPIGVHVPEQAAGAPFATADQFVVKFINHFTVRLPDGFAMLYGHPLNRADLPFRTLWGLVEGFADGTVHFPALWSDPGFSGTLAKGTPVAQAVPVPTGLSLTVGAMDDAAYAAHLAVEDRLQGEPGVYRRARSSG